MMGDSSTGIEKFCGSKLWDPSLTWYTDIPDFTKCFQDIFLVLTPCAFFCIVILIHLWKLSYRSVSPLPWTLLNCTKIVFGICLFVISVTEGYFHWSNNFVSVADITTYCICVKIVTYLIIIMCLQQHQYRGIESCTVLSCFWLVLSFCGIFVYRSTLLKVFIWNFPSVNNENFVLNMLYYPLVFCQFFLSFFSDTGGTDSQEKNVFDKLPFFTFFTFSWLDGLICKSVKQTLKVDDLPSLSMALKSTYVWSKFKEKWLNCKNKMKDKELICDDSETSHLMKVSLMKTLLKAFWPWILFSFIYMFFFNAIQFAPSLILDLIIGFISDDTYVWQGYLYCAAIFFFGFISRFASNTAMFYSALFALQSKSALSSAVYRKCLRLSSSARRKYTSGEIVNLLSVDIDKTFHSFLFCAMLLGSLLAIVISIALLWQYLGPSCLSGLAVIFLIMPVNGILMKKAKVAQEQQMRLKDSRLKNMNEILNGIKVLKLWAWETAFMEKIDSIRKIEVNFARVFQYCYAVFSFFWGCAPFLVAVACFVTYIFVDKNNILKPSVVFVSINLLNLMRFALFHIPDLIANLIQTNISLRRLRIFLSSEEIKQNAIGNVPDKDEVVSIRNATFSWDVNEDEGQNLKDINLHISEGALVAIIGPVGSGKSSLLSAILGDMKKMSGSVDVKGNLAYVPQQAWIQNQTIRQNIIFVKPMHKEKYNETLSCCCLKPDLKIFPGRDMTEIGEKGINLSGGQKQRISLARAVYQDADVYLLDDPLSAVDAHIGKELFENVIGNNGVLKNKTRILVTHSLTFLSDVDLVITMNDGKIDEIGTYKDLINHSSTFMDFIEKHRNIIEAPENPLVEKEILSPAIDKLDIPMMLKSRSLIEKSFSNTQTTIVKPPSRESISSQLGVKLIEDEKMEIGKVKLSVYVQFFKNTGVHFLLPAIFGYIGYQAFEIASNIWLSKWSMDPVFPDGSQDPSLRNKRIAVYAVLGLCETLCLLSATLLLATGIARAGKYYHKQMFNSVMRSPLSFFDTTPIGRIMNRFGKDMDVIDTYMLYQLDGWFACLFSTIGNFIVIGMGTPIFFAIMVPIGVIYYVTQKLYLIASCQIKRLDSTTLSPVFSHLSETVSGVSSIKAYNVEEHFIKTFETKVDTNITCYYYWSSCNRWLAFRLDLAGNVILLIAALLAIQGRGTLDAGTIGLTLTYALLVTDNFNWLIRTNTELENNSVSVERIDEYSNLPSEAPWFIKNFSPPDSWPAAGAVSFRNYSTRYREGLDLVLRHINFDIKPNEKVGIVGRTGAGKSSVTLALFRIIEPADGDIVIDNVNLSQIGLYDLRSNLTIIPQDPVLFTGSLRMNLDPNDIYSDEELWTSLEHAHLKHFIKSLSAGLDYDIAEGGENLSVGQRQLVCLARALLKKSRILVLDEATAAVDMDTDQLIQNTIRTEFENYTVITIAHRLHTILDYDKVIVMDCGKIIETGNPTELLQKPNSKFYNLAKDTGLV